MTDDKENATAFEFKLELLTESASRNNGWDLIAGSRAGENVNGTQRTAILVARTTA